MKHALWLMLILSGVIGLGAGLGAAGLLEVVEWWISSAYHQVIVSPDGKMRSEYNPGSSSPGVTLAGWGTALFAGGVTFGWLLCQLPGRAAGEVSRKATDSSA